MKNDVSIVVPAYNPGQALEDVIHELKEKGFINIVVIDDGSSNAKSFENLSDIIILKNDVNRGKGNALKRGFFYCRNNLKEIKGIITVDADGQHLIKDVENIYKSFSCNYNSLILGTRSFNEKGVPLKSKLGNRIMQNKIKSKTGVNIKDTQTGLRAIPVRYLKNLLDLNGDRYEYETNMLLYFINNKIEIIQIPINTVYLNKNRCTYFKPLRDSLRVYKLVK